MFKTNYCTVKQNMGMISEDSPGDDDRLPDFTNISGKVVFTPTTAPGNAYQVIGEDGEAYTVPVASVEADIIDGRIFHEGQEGILLFAAGDNATPDKIVYRVTYSGLRAGGVPVNLSTIFFEAVPGAVIDLTRVTPVPGAPVAGTVKGDKGDTGPRGPEGPKGPKGDKGDPGEVTLEQLNQAIRVAATAATEYVDASIWPRTPLAGTDNIDELTPGLYPVRNGATATALGLPEGTIGSIEHIVLDPSSLYRRQYYRADPTNGAAVEYRRTYYNGTWNAWEKVYSGSGGDTVGYYRGAVPDGITPEEMTGADYQGLWTYSSGQAAGWSIPSRAAGIIEVAASGLSTLHQVSTLTTPIRNFQRRWYNGTWSGPWETLGGGSTPAPEPEQPPAVVEVDEYATETSKSAINLLMPSVVDPTLSYEDDHSALVADLKSRLGTVDTGGKAAVALVADHGTTAFKEWLWAEAKSRDIPFTMALAPEVHLDGKGDTRHTATNEDIKQWISEGLVIASHSGDHGGALGYFDVSRQIKTSKAKLEEKLETTVDCWVQPGYTLALGNYDGFGTGQSESRYTDYYAGRMLQQTYPVITGYAGDDFVYPGGVDLPVGVRRSLTERKGNQAGVIANIEQAITTGGKHINFCHPYALPDSSNTYVTKTEYIAYLDWLVAKRDAGDLVLLTLPELAVAQ